MVQRMRSLRTVRGVDGVFSEAHLYGLVSGMIRWRFNVQPVMRKAPVNVAEMDTLLASAPSVLRRTRAVRRPA